MKRFYLIAIMAAAALSFVVHGATAQNRLTVSGTVRDSGGAGVVGASVIIRNTVRGTTTDADGHYTLAVDSPQDVLVCSFVGMKSEECAVGSRRTIDFTLTSDVIDIDAVVAIGYGTIRREEVTSSITRVSADDFLQGSVCNPLQLVQGKVAGLGISKTSGDPSGELSIMLRGISTLAASSAPLIVIDGVAGGSLNAVSPEDIESIDVLKDGSAAAIYGTRGTNGVIVITTRRPESGRVSLEYKGYLTVDRMLDETADYPNATELRALRAKLMEEDSRFGLINDFGGDTDWVKRITRTPVSHTHYISLRGGGARTSYLASVTYNDKQGIYPGSADESLSAKIAIDHRMFDDRLKIQLNLNNKAVRQGIVASDLYSLALSRNPTIPVFNDDGSYYENSNGANPVAQLREESTENRYDQLMLSGKIAFEPVRGLTLSATGVFMGDFNERAFSTTHDHYSSTMGSTRGQARLSGGHGMDRTLDLQADYSLHTGGHNLSLTAGYSYNSYLYQKSSMYAYDFPIDGAGAWNIGSANSTIDGTSTLASYKYGVKLIGFYGRANYNFDSRYLLMASVRYEGSDKFGRNNRWGVFPAVSAGWRISQERFMRGVRWISDLKLRVGYGITGTAPAAAYQYMQLYNFSTSYMAYDGGKWVNAIIPTTNANDDLKWERKKELNAGVDFAMFGGRLRGSVDYYNRRTDDLLYTYNVPTPPNITNTMLANVGSMRNSGVELTLSGDIIARKDMTLSVSGNFSYNSNRLISLSNERYTMEYLTLGSTGQPMQTYTHRLEDGWKVGNFYGWRVNGLKNSTTWNVVGAENADPSEDHKRIIGNGMPDMFAGLQINFRYKGFDATVSLRGTFGFDILNAYRMKYETLAWLSSQNLPKRAYEKIGEYYNFASSIYTDYYIERGDYVKLDNLSLGYTFDLSRRNKVLRNIRVFFTGMNLLTFTGYSGLDPEVSIVGLTPGVDPIDKYPNLRSYVVGASFNF